MEVASAQAIMAEMSIDLGINIDDLPYGEDRSGGQPADQFRLVSCSTVPALPPGALSPVGPARW